MAPDRGDRTGVVIPPPLLYAGPFLVGWLIGYWRRWQLLEIAVAGDIVGAAVLVGGAGIAAVGVWQFRRARTTVLPFGGTSSVVASGGYRWTRNPMYLGMALAYIGGAFLVNSAWCVAFLPISIPLIHLLVIRTEERYLSTKFGETYDQYRSRVRRRL